MKNAFLTIAAAAVLAAGCAQPTATSSEERADTGTITGSRLPRKSDENPQGVRATSREDYETNKPPAPMKGGG